MTDMKDWDEGFSTDENMDNDIIELTDIIEPDLDDADDDPIIELTDIIEHASDGPGQDLAGQDLELDLEGVNGSEFDLEEDQGVQEERTGDFQELELELDDSQIEDVVTEEITMDETPLEGIDMAQDGLEIEDDFQSLDTSGDTEMDDDIDSFDQMDGTEEEIPFDALEMDIDDEDDSFEDMTFDADEHEESEVDTDADNDMDSVDIDLDRVEYQADAEPEESSEPEIAAVPLPVTDSPGVTISDEQLDAALERVIEKKFADKIEVVLLEVMQQVIEKEISQIKQTLQEDLDQIGTA